MALNPTTLTPTFASFGSLVPLRFSFFAASSLLTLSPSLSTLSAAIGVEGYTADDWRIYSTETGLSVSGASVAGWADALGRSGAWAFTGAGQPAYVAAALNGQPVARFVGIGTGSDNNSALTAFVQNANGFVFSGVASTGTAASTSASGALLVGFYKNSDMTSFRLSILRPLTSNRMRTAFVRGDANSAGVITGPALSIDTGIPTSMSVTLDYANNAVNAWSAGVLITGSPVNPSGIAGSSTSDFPSNEVRMGRATQGGSASTFSGDIAGVFLLKRTSGANSLANVRAAIETYWTSLFGVS